MEDEDFFALCIIIQYYRPATGRRIISQRDVAVKVGVDEHFFNNFIAGSSRDARREDVEKILDFFKNWLTAEKNKEYLNSPVLIQRAAETVYKLGSERVGNIIRNLADNRPEAVKIFNKNYSGVYDVWRYSAHQASEFKPVRGHGGVLNYWVTRAALQIFPAPSPKQYPRFEIRYRACKRTDAPRDANTVEGEVVVIQRYMYFFGYEHGTGYPLVIVAKHNAQVSTTFKGIVVRNNVNSGTMFGSRVTFIKNVGAVNLKELDDECYIELDKDVEEKIKSFRNDMLNDVEYEGRGGLRL